MRLQGSPRLWKQHNKRTWARHSCQQQHLEAAAPRSAATLPHGACKHANPSIPEVPHMVLCRQCAAQGARSCIQCALRTPAQRHFDTAPPVPGTLSCKLHWFWLFTITPPRAGGQQLANAYTSPSPVYPDWLPVKRQLVNRCSNIFN